MGDQELLTLGRVSGVFGVKGWIKVFSFTKPRENILSYSPWLLSKGDQVKTINLLSGKRQGKSVIAQLQDIEDCDQAILLNGWDISIDKSQLPEIDKDEYYWTDLVGLQVHNLDGVDFGIIDTILETGANDVLVVKGERERLIPFLQQQTVINIDLDNGMMTVDWDADF